MFVSRRRRRDSTRASCLRRERAKQAHPLLPAPFFQPRKGRLRYGRRSSSALSPGDGVDGGAALTFWLTISRALPCRAAICTANSPTYVPALALVFFSLTQDLLSLPPPVYHLYWHKARDVCAAKLELRAESRLERIARKVS